jgi:hypothetical protein
MTGKIKKMIDSLIEIRAQGNQSLVATTRTKLLLKGIDPGKYTEATEDNPEIIAKIKSIAGEMGITLND